MSHPTLSEKYVRVAKWGYSIALVIIIVAAVAFLLLPFATKLPSATKPLRSLGTLAILGALCAFRLESMREHQAIYRAITKEQSDGNTDDSDSIPQRRTFE